MAIDTGSDKACRESNLYISNPERVSDISSLLAII